MNEGLLEKYKKCWKSLTGYSAKEDYEYPSEFWDLAQKAMSVNLSVESFEEGIKIFISNNSEEEENFALEALEGILEQQGEEIISSITSKRPDLKLTRIEDIEAICEKVIVQYNVEEHIPRIALHILMHLNLSNLSLEQVIRKSFVDAIALSDLLKKELNPGLDSMLSLVKRLSKDDLCEVLTFISMQFTIGLKESWGIISVLFHVINAVYETETFDSVKDYLCISMDCCYVLAALNLGKR